MISRKLDEVASELDDLLIDVDELRDVAGGPDDESLGKIEEALDNPVDHKSTLQERLARRGELVEYDEKGRVTERATYRDGKLDGELVRYMRSGKVREKLKYKDGKQL